MVGAVDGNLAGVVVVEVEDGVGAAAEVDGVEVEAAGMAVVGVEKLLKLSQSAAEVADGPAVVEAAGN